MSGVLALACVGQLRSDVGQACLSRGVLLCGIYKVDRSPRVLMKAGGVCEILRGRGVWSFWKFAAGVANLFWFCPILERGHLCKISGTFVRYFYLIFLHF